MQQRREALRANADHAEPHHRCSGGTRRELRLVGSRQLTADPAHEDHGVQIRVRIEQRQHGHAARAITASRLVLVV